MKIFIYYTDVNECLNISSCPVNSTCINSNGSFTCSCTNSGYTYNGTECIGNLTFIKNVISTCIGDI